MCHSPLLISVLLLHCHCLLSTLKKGHHYFCSLHRCHTFIYISGIVFNYNVWCTLLAHALFLLSLLRICVCVGVCVCAWLSVLADGTQGRGLNMSFKAAQTKLAVCPFQVKTESSYLAASCISL